MTTICIRDRFAQLVGDVDKSDSSTGLEVTDVS